MTVEFKEIQDFLAVHHPFDLLPDDVLESLPSKMKSEYGRRGSTILESETPCEFLYVVRTGAVETTSPDGQLLARLSQGECFGVNAMLRGGIALNNVTAIEDSLFYMVPFEVFQTLCKNHPQFSYFFAPLGADRLRDAHQHGTGQAKDEQLNLMTICTSDLLVREPVTIKLGTTVTDAANVMSEARVSCVLVMTEDNAIAGIMTDRDLRTRLVAEGKPYDTLVDEIMTHDPISLSGNSVAFDALLTMTRYNIRHLPITHHDGSAAGVITSTNLIEKQSTSAVYMVGDIYKRTDYAGIAEVVRKLPQLLMHLVDSGANSNTIGRMTTAISDAATIRLLQLAEAELGAAPVPYAWLAGGSQGRQEQTGVSDQDNCIIVDNAYDPEVHGDYFATLAQYVCTGLDKAGYIFCPGEMMAMTPKWLQPVKAWQKYFTKWIDEPDPEALMLASVFFDLRFISGKESLFDDLRSVILKKAKGNKIFTSFMTGNALTHTPPLGFFKNFVLIKGGEHDHHFDLKHNGVVPIVDIARTYALEFGVESVNTYDRLLASRAENALSESGAKDLLDAYEFISITRLKHQAEQIRKGEKPDNFMAPENMSDFERNHLKDAFSVVKTIQSAMASRYGKT